MEWIVWRRWCEGGVRGVCERGVWRGWCEGGVWSGFCGVDFVRGVL